MWSRKVGAPRIPTLPGMTHHMTNMSNMYMYMCGLWWRFEASNKCGRVVQLRTNTQQTKGSRPQMTCECQSCLVLLNPKNLSNTPRLDTGVKKNGKKTTPSHSRQARHRCGLARASK